jgi:hypothetical protein
MNNDKLKLSNEDLVNFSPKTRKTQFALDDSFINLLEEKIKQMTPHFIYVEEKTEADKILRKSLDDKYKKLN